MPAIFNKRGLSVVPEGCQLRGRLCFTFIGPNSRELVRRIAASNLCSEVAEACSVADGRRAAWAEESPAPATSPSSSSSFTPVGVGGRSPKDAKGKAAKGGGSKGQEAPKELGIFTRLEQDNSEVLRVKLHVVESFHDSLAAKEIAECGLRNACFVFLMDPRADLGREAVPVLNQAFAEMMFLRNLGQHKADKDKLRALVLAHCGDVLEGDDFPEEVSSFNAKLLAVTRSFKTKQQLHTTDFDDGDAMFEMLEEIATTIFRLNTVRRSTTILKRQFAHVGSWVSSRVSVAKKDQPKEERCCSVQ